MRTYKYKLLSAKRNKKLHRQINAGAVAWNHCVVVTRRFYRFYGKSVSENALKKHLTKLKKRVPYGYLCEMGSQALQDVVERLYRSYKRFFDAKKNGEKCGLPGFKKVRKYKSFTLKQAGYKLLDGNELVICGQKYKYFKSREIEGKIKTLTVKRDSVNNLWLCFAVEDEAANRVLPRLGKAVGLDFGLKTYLTGSDETTIESPEFFKQNLKAVKRLHRILSRKQKGSANYRRARRDLARLYRHIANQRMAWQWEKAWKLVENYAFIGLETLNIKAMQRLWGRKVSDYGFSEFSSILSYVASKVGTQVVHVDQWFASSQLCSACGFKFEGTKDLNVRQWTCPHCGAEHDRDVNAARNILAEALRIVDRVVTGGTIVRQGEPELDRRKSASGV